MLLSRGSVGISCFTSVCSTGREAALPLVQGEGGEADTNVSFYTTYGNLTRPGPVPKAWARTAKKKKRVSALHVTSGLVLIRLWEGVDADFMPWQLAEPMSPSPCSHDDAETNIGHKRARRANDHATTSRNQRTPEQEPQGQPQARGRLA